MLGIETDIYEKLEKRIDHSIGEEGEQWIHAKYEDVVDDVLDAIEEHEDAPKSSVGMVKEFHETFELTVNDTPTIPSRKDMELRINLMFEELMEFAQHNGCLSHFADKLEEALSGIKSGSIPNINTNMVGMLDALADMRYVADGTIVTLGLHRIFSSAFTEVHRSNMSKACNSVDEVDRTTTYHTKKQFEETGEQVFEHLTKHRGDKYIVTRAIDGKIMKSVDYSPADLKQFIR